MAGSSSIGKALLAGTALAATLLGASVAGAQEGPPVPVSFHDPVAALGEENASAPVIDVSSQRAIAPRFALTPTTDGPAPRRLELQVAAGGGNSPVDVSLAQRATVNADDDADRRGSGSELRVGRGLVERREGSAEPSVYMFVASDDEALTWQPGGSRSEFGGRGGGGIALEDRVEVGDMSAGVTYERNGVQASLAYVEREESTRVGRENYTQEQAFTGVTLTMRR